MLRNDEGRPLEVKEGILLDQEGTPLHVPAGASESPDAGWGPRFNTRGASRVKVVRLGGGGLGMIAMLLILPLLFVAGFTVLAVFAAVFLIFGALRLIVRALMN